MATFVNDTFTESGGDVFLSGHTGETGATWTHHPASAANISVDATADRIFGPDATGTGRYYASGTPATANYYVEGVFDYIGSGNNYPGILGRLNSSSPAEYYVLRISQSAGRIELAKYVNSTWSYLDTYSMATNVGMTLKLEMIGSSIKGYVDGVERVSATDSDITAAGTVGVQFTSSGGSLGKLIGNQITSLTAVDIESSSTVLIMQQE